jgi:hypothetical protein
MTLIHRYIGWSIVIALALLAVYGLGVRLLRRDDPGVPFWGLLYYTETVLVIQIVVGVVLLLMGRRVGTGFDLHYFYGSLFPLIALVGGRIFSMRRDDAEEPYTYVPIAFGAFVAFGLTTRAMMIGLGYQ